MSGSLFEMDAYGGLQPAKDICANRHGGSETSIAAHEGTSQEKRDSDKRRILELSQRDEGVTLHEACEDMKRNPNELSGRFSEMVRDGQLSRRGETRKTPTGSSAKVHHFRSWTPTK
jgi:hypothetical protein